ncbi:MAG: hypothetical protein ACXADY_06705 [Candidatus Hodarchaeales archaeon]|jgi:hypothetical protein
MTANAAVKLKGYDLTSIVTIDSHERCKEVLIGRKFLDSYYLTLKGPDEELIIEFQQ